MGNQYQEQEWEGTGGIREEREARDNKDQLRHRIQVHKPQSQQEAQLSVRTEWGWGKGQTLPASVAADPLKAQAGPGMGTSS